MADLSRGPTSNPGVEVRGLRATARLARAFTCAWTGLVDTWRRQPNFRIETGIGVAALALATWLGDGIVTVLLFSALVLGLELVNTSVEATIDLVSPEHNPIARRAKDAAAAAVLVAAAAAATAGLIVLGPLLLQQLGLVS